MIIVVGDTPSSVEINAGGRIGDPSKMAAAQYVSSNRQHQSMGRLPIYVYGLHPIPGLITCTDVPHSLPYLSSLHTHTHCEVLFCPGWHSEHYSCFCDLAVYDPGLFTPVDSLLPALVILLLEVPIVLLPALTPAQYCLHLCLASDISDTDGWSLPVWPCLSLLKQDCKWIHTPQTLRYITTMYLRLN